MFFLDSYESKTLQYVHLNDLINHTSTWTVWFTVN